MKTEREILNWFSFSHDDLTHITIIVLRGSVEKIIDSYNNVRIININLLYKKIMTKYM